MSQLITKDILLQMEDEMLQLPQVDCPVFHRFGPDLYIREVFIPKGSVAIGHHQNFEHLNVFLKGKVMMINEDGSNTILEAPMQFIGKPGRKIGYILEDMVWQNIYATKETDIEKLEAHYLTKSDAWQYNNTLKMSIKKLEREGDRQDYYQFLNDINYTESMVREQSENESDQIRLEVQKVMVSDSPIEGKGLFATANFNPEEVIMIARLNGKRTQAGRFTNHSPTPNAKMVGVGDDIYLVAIKKIEGCKGGCFGDEITVDYRQAISETLRVKELSCQE